MKETGWMMFTATLNHFHTSDKNSMLKWLPKDQADNVVGYSLPKNAFEKLVESPSQPIERIHYSWLKPIFEKQTPDLQNIYLSALPDSHYSGLCHLLHKTFHKLDLSLPVRHYLLGKIYQQMDLTAIPPLAFLPASPLDPLLDCTKQQLVELIDFLGLHDLAAEIRFIVDKKKLQGIYSLLTHQKQQYLKQCLHEKDKLSVPKLGLEQWSGDIKALEKMIHRRGMVRFAKVLQPLDTHFNWYILHTLDVGRGTIIPKFFSEKENPEVTKILTEQTLALIEFLKQG